MTGSFEAKYLYFRKNKSSQNSFIWPNQLNYNNSHSWK